MQVGNQLGRVVHFLTVELNDQIAGPQAGTRCGAVRKNFATRAPFSATGVTFA